MKNQEGCSRRHFLKSTGGAASMLGTLAAGAPAVLSAKSPNDTIGVGQIGIGVRGGTLITQVAGRQLGGGIKGAKIVAVCDVYKPHMQKGVDRSMNPDVKTYVDYKDLLADPDVDAVIIATPDHWHSQIVIDAANAGKDIYVEKGWTRTIEEAKAMRKAVKENNVIMQLGHQSRGRVSGAIAADLINDGIIGPVTLVRTGRFENNPMGKNIWRWYGWYNYYERPNPKDVIENLDWKRWLGPAKDIPFNMEHFWHWRCYWPYGTGVAGDLLSHEVDFVHSVLRLGIPDTCMTSGQNILLKDGRQVPDTWNSVFQYKKKETTVTFDCSMNSSFVQPPEFRGKEGMLRFNSIAQAVSRFDVYPDAKSAKYQSKLDSGKLNFNESLLDYESLEKPEFADHMQNFFNCIRSRKKTRCDEDEAFIEAATLVMSVKSLQEKRQVSWDADNEVVL